MHPLGASALFSDRSCSGLYPGQNLSQATIKSNLAEGVEVVHDTKDIHETGRPALLSTVERPAGALTDQEVPITARIRAQLPRLQPAMRRVGELIVTSPRQVSEMTISSLARKAETSETTVIRFCREMDVPGYSQLRLALASEIGARTQDSIRCEESTDISEGDDVGSVIEKIAYADVRSVTDTVRSLSIDRLSEVVAKIVQAKRIETFGVAASGIVAADLQQKLHRIGMVSFAFADPHVAVASVALLQPGDVAIAFSHSGCTPETVEWLHLARSVGATTVVVTNVPGSLLTEFADYSLITVALETSFRAGATGSRLSQLTIVDCLFIAAAQQSYDSSIQALKGTRAAVSGLRERRVRS